MAIKINGVEITSNKLNGSDVLAEKLNGTLVYPIMPELEWYFVGQYSSEPYYDLYIPANIQGDYEQGLYYLNTNYPASDGDEGFTAVINDSSSHSYFQYVIVAGNFEFYEVTLGEYNSKVYKLNVTITEGSTAEDVMDAFKTQLPQYYQLVDSSNYHTFGVRADDGLGYSYWALRLK